MKLRKDGKVDKRTTKYIMVEWTDLQGHYRGGSYPEHLANTQVEALKRVGITNIFVDEKPV